VTEPKLAAPPERALAGHQVSAPGARQGAMLAVLLVGQLMALLDAFIVNVAMPVIGVSLHASGASLQLIVGGYMIAYATFLITGARLGAMLGRRRMYLAGVLIFTAASLGCGLAQGSAGLIAFRIVQGAGAAVMVPQIMSVIQTQFSGPARARALSAYAVVLSAGAVAGLVIGGLLVNANLFGETWRPVFFVNVPLGIILAAAVPRLVPADRPGGGRLDLAGLAVAIPAILLIVFPLVLGREAGWPAWSFACMGAGLVLAAAFVAVERRLGARGGSPLLNLAVLRARGLRPGFATLSCISAAYGGFVFTFTLHLEAGLGDSPLRTGLTWIPMAMAFGLTGYYWRRLPQRIHHLVVPAGMALSVLGFAAIAAALHGAGPSSGSPGPLLWAGQVVLGVGLGATVSPLLTQSLLHVPLARAADASGLLTTTMQLGQLIGVAVFGSLYLSLVTGLRSSAHAFAAAGYSMAALAAAGTLLALLLARSVRLAGA
jgi:MFS family permease